MDGGAFLFVFVFPMLFSTSFQHSSFRIQWKRKEQKCRRAYWKCLVFWIFTKCFSWAKKLIYFSWVCWVREFRRKKGIIKRILKWSFTFTCIKRKDIAARVGYINLQVLKKTHFGGFCLSWTSFSFWSLKCIFKA